MKLFILAITITMIGNNTIAQMKTTKAAAKPQKEDSFGRLIFSAFVQQDKNTFIALYPTNEEYKSILQAGLAAKAPGLTQQKIDEMLIKRSKEAAAAYTNLFNKYKKMADSLGVQWKEAVYEKFDFNPVYPVPVKLKYLEATIWFSCGKKHYAMDGIQAVEIPAGYRLQAITNIVQVEDGN